MPLVCTKWYDLGLELLNSKYEKELDTIETDSKAEGSKVCCRKMFNIWLDSDSVSWGQLVRALRRIEQNHVASEIEKLFKGEYDIGNDHYSDG